MHCIVGVSCVFPVFFALLLGPPAAGNVGAVRSMFSNVLFVCSIVCLLAGRAAESVSIDGFACIVDTATPSATFGCFVLIRHISVTPKIDRFSGRIVALFLQ